MDMLAACGSTHAASLEVYRRVFEDCPDYITISWLDTGVYIDVNPGFQRFTGYRRDEVVGRSSLDLGIWPVLEERHRFIQQIREHGACREFTCHIGRCDGAVVEAEIAGSVTLLDGRPVLLAVVRDVGERHRTQAELAQYRNQLEQLVAQRTEALSKAHAALRVAHEKLVESESQARFQAHHDALTGLPNRALLIDRLEHALSVAHRGDESLALLFIDLNEFKHVNDSLGHQAGDEVLAIVAERLQRCVRKSDTVARLGGDEFVVAVSGTEAAQHAAQIAQKLLKAIEEPIRVRQQICRTAGSIGIAVYPADGDSVALLMQAADTAMYHAKADGKCGYRFHCVQMQAEAQRRHTLDNELHQALVEHQFVLHFQPQFDMRTGRILALEALVRWQHPVRGLVPPLDFIAFAEQTGMIGPLGEWVLREACRHLGRWRAMGHPALRMAVNLSPRQLWTPGFVDVVREVLWETGLPGDAIDAEITEGLLMQPTADNLATLRALTDLGVCLAIDDFGTGYSSLAYLKSYPIHALKVDRSFVNNITSDARDLAIVSTIVAMAGQLGLQVIAEGVETREQARLLVAHGCHIAQGYLYSRPLEAARVDALMSGAYEVPAPP